jgi:hypothetical protein
MAAQRSLEPLVEVRISGGNSLSVAASARLWRHPVQSCALLRSRNCTGWLVLGMLARSTGWVSGDSRGDTETERP